MTPERWEQVKEILGKALELHSPDRESYLETACGSDPIVQREVQRLLIAEESAGTGFLNLPAMPTRLEIDDLPPDSMIGRRVGAYQTAELIGVGGMGEVYRAFRADDQYRKQVALKLVRAGQDSQFVFSRFKNERQILASLDHPNIARLLDGGTTEEGAPYFVMELIEGQPLGQYCDAHKLRINDRLKLFLQVCSAVQFAHQRLVVHRDIKPSNILVTADGTPKLLDFGVSKILDPDMVDGQADPTLTGFRALTPAYASPEQIKGEPITTASDVYSLGVVLYELLTGRSRYPVSTRTPHEISRAVCDLEPEKPSVAVRRPVSPQDEKSSPGDHGDVSPAKLSKQLKGDLDNIVLIALRKEPSRRYASVEEFAGDIRRHLEHLPVAARKGTVGYRASKFVRRHTAGLVATAIVVAALLTGMGMTLAQKRRADRRFNDVRVLANSLLFQIHDSIQFLQGATSARKLIVQQGLQYLDSLSAESADDPGLQRELAAGYEKLGDVQASTSLGNVGDRAGGIASYRKAVKLREGLKGRLPRDLAVQSDLAMSYQRLAGALQRIGNQIEGDEYLERAFQIARRLAEEHPNDATILNSLGMIDWQRGGSLWRQAKIDDALHAYRESAENFSRVTILEPANKRARRSLAVAYKYIGGELEIQKKLDEAISNYRLASDIDRQLLQREPENVMYLRDATVDFRNFGDILVKQEKFKEAQENYESAMAIDKRLVGKDSADRDTQVYLALDHEDMGKVLLKMRNGPAAVAFLQAALKIHEERIKADPGDADAKDMLADSYVLLGDAYATLAQSPMQSRNSSNPKSSCSAYGSAVKIWNALQKDGRLNKIYETHRTSLVARMRNCN